MKPIISVVQTILSDKIIPIREDFFEAKVNEAEGLIKNSTVGLSILLSPRMQDQKKCFPGNIM